MRNLIHSATQATMVAAALTFSACDSSTDSGRQSTTSTPGPACNATWSRDVAEKARTTPMVRDVAVRSDGLHIVVGAPQWAILKLDERDRLVSAFDCAIAGPGYLKQVIVEDPRGNTLKTYGPVELYAARKLQP